MSNLEHYFENLLFDGKDCRGDVNKNALTKEEQEAVEICAQYVIWSIFDGRDEFKNFIRQEFEPVKHGQWVKDNGPYSLYKCSVCNEYCTVAGWANCIPEERMYKGFKYCPNCGAKMDEVEE